MNNEIQLGSKSVKASEIKQISIARNVGIIHSELPSIMSFNVFEIVCYDKDLLTDENLDAVSVNELEQFAKQHPEIQLIENAKVLLRPTNPSA